MTDINQLSAIDTLQAGDLLAIWDVSNSDTRKAALSALLSFMQSNLVFPDTDTNAFTKQFYAPNATGFSVTITDGDDDDNNVWLILTPNASYAAGTIVLPAFTSLRDTQEVLVNCTRQVNALTIDKNGATAVRGAPSSLAADSFFRLKYDAQLKTWYRVG